MFDLVRYRYLGKSVALWVFFSFFVAQLFFFEKAWDSKISEFQLDVFWSKLRGNNLRKPFGEDMGVEPKIGGFYPPKWMVKKNGSNPIKIPWIWGVNFPPICGSTPTLGDLFVGKKVITRVLPGR